MPPPIVESALNELRMESRSAASVTSSRFAGKRVHFIGIGGSGMSGLARMLLDGGAHVSGSEPKPNGQTFELAKRGVRISRTQMGEFLARDIDLVVRTAAIPDSNAEFQAAKALGIPTIKYAQLLGQVMAERTGIAVAGTHGKTTTTAMISHALLVCGAEPSFVIGGTVPQLGGGSRSGKGNVFVAEACEYDRSFHNLHPKIALITNIEEDHLDCYKDLAAIIESFRTFAELLPKDGLLITSGKDANLKKVIDGLKVPVQLCALTPHAGASSAKRIAAPDPKHKQSWTTQNTGIENGCYRGEISFNNKPVATIRLSVPGEHNLINATMAVAACFAVGIDPPKAADAIGGFLGVDRRMTEMGRFNAAIVVDDYGHHPTEIRATLKALQEKYQPKRLFCVFQPHQHSRTRFLLDDFARSFADATETIVPDIYFVRDSEADRSAVNARDLVQRVEQNGQRAVHLPEFRQIVEYLRTQLREGDVVVTMGAGNVWEIGRELVS